MKKEEIFKIVESLKPLYEAINTALEAYHCVYKTDHRKILRFDSCSELLGVETDFCNDGINFYWEESKPFGEWGTCVLFLPYEAIENPQLWKENELEKIRTREERQRK